MNAFPTKGGIQGNYSPAFLLEGKPNSDAKRKRISFGAYALAYDMTTNTQRKRAIPCVALNEANGHDSYYFLSLETGRQLHTRKWSEQPMNDLVVEKVIEMATRQKQPKMPGKMPIFEWALGIVIDLPEMDEDDEVRGEENIENRNQVKNDNIRQMTEYSHVISDDEDSNDNDNTYVESRHDEDNRNLLMDNVGEHNANQIEDDRSEEEENDDNHSQGEEENDDNYSQGDDNAIYEAERNNEDSNGDECHIDAEVNSIHSSEYSFNVMSNDGDIDGDDLDKTISISEKNHQTFDDDTFNSQHTSDDDVSDYNITDPPNNNQERPNNLGDSKNDQGETVASSDYSTRPRRANADAGIERLKMSHSNKQYASVQSKMMILRKSLNILLTQMSAKVGMRIFGERAGAVAAMIKEL